MDDNHPFADKSSTKSISLIQNWDSISDKESFPKTKSIVILAQIDTCNRYFKSILVAPAYYLTALERHLMCFKSI